MEKLLEIKEFLKKVPIFSCLKDDELSDVAKGVKEKNFSRKDTILERGEKGGSLFLIKEGLVKVCLKDKLGKELILKILGPGEFFGEMALLDGEPRSASVVALERTVVYVLERENLLELIRRKPEISLRMLISLSHRLRETDKKLAALALGDAYGKVASVLLELAEEKGKKVEEGIYIDIPISRGQLAAMAGVTRETASRVLSVFKDVGIIKLDEKGLTILSLEKLKREVRSWNG